MTTRGRFWYGLWSRIVFFNADTSALNGRQKLNFGPGIRATLKLAAYNTQWSLDQGSSSYSSVPGCGLMIPSFQIVCLKLSKMMSVVEKDILWLIILRFYKNALVQRPKFFNENHFNFGSTYRLTFGHYNDLLNFYDLWFPLIEASGFLFQFLKFKDVQDAF